MATGADRQADQHGTYPFDLGSYRRTASTSSAQAGRWFDRGLIWSYAFNHEEAIACFQRAIDADPNCAMAYWGLAYAAGPNYNKQWDAFDEDDLRASLRRSRAATVQAAGLAATGSQLERDLIGALDARYPSDQPDGDLNARNVAYADAMGEVYRAHGADLDIAALYADALLNITAWSLWDLESGRPADGARTIEAKDVLEQAMQAPGGMTHPGILHFYIHLMEMSPQPEVAQAAADALRSLCAETRPPG